MPDKSLQRTLGSTALRFLIFGGVALFLAGALIVLADAYLFEQTPQDPDSPRIFRRNVSINSIAKDHLGYVVIEIDDGSDVYVAGHWIGSWVQNAGETEWVGGSIRDLIARIVGNDSDVAFRISTSAPTSLARKEWLVREIYAAYPEGTYPPPIPGSPGIP
jgi:hypothetical protein